MRIISLEEHYAKIEKLEQLTKTVNLINREFKSWKWRKGGKRKK